MARLLFKPFAIISSVAASRVAGKLFAKIWPKLDRSGDGSVPSATAAESTLPRAAAASMVQAATYAGTRAVMDRARVRVIYHFTGLWAGDKAEKPVEEVSVPE